MKITKWILMVVLMVFAYQGPAHAELFYGEVTEVDEKNKVITIRPDGYAPTGSEEAEIRIGEEAEILGITEISDLNDENRVSIIASKDGPGGLWYAKTIRVVHNPNQERPLDDEEESASTKTSTKKEKTTKVLTSEPHSVRSVKQ